MTQPNKAIPAEIKEYIQKLKQHYVIYTNDKAEHLYNIDTATPTNLNQLARIFRKQYNNFDGIYSDYANYVLSSIPQVCSTTFKPSAPRITEIDSFSNIGKLNTYKDITNPIPLGDIQDPSIWFEYLSRLFIDKDEKHTVCQWLAHMFQNPSERPSWHLLITSDTGTGKGYLFANIVAPLLQHQVTQADNYNAVLKTHSTLLADSLFLLLDDPKSKSDSIHTQMKSKLSEPWITIERKHEREVRQETFTRVMLCSNEKRPLKLDANERRWFAPRYIKHKDNLEETATFISKLDTWLSNGGLSYVHDFFINYDITDFNPRHIHQTETLLTMIDNSVPIAVEQLKEFLEDNEVFTWHRLKEHENFNAARDDLIKHYLIEMNYGSFRTTIEGRKITLWKPDNMTNADAKALHSTELSF